MELFELEIGEKVGPRAGTLKLPSGIEVRTPLFMPVATKLSVKTLNPEEVKATGTSTVITNGFLTTLEPGSDEVRQMGGMHRMMGWDGGIFSDSGGFQFIRKGFEAKVEDKGVQLRSPYSGSPVFLTPEDVVDMHVMHGVDVGMVLDHCPPLSSSEEEIQDSADRTVLWAGRSKERIGSEGMKDLLPEGIEELPLMFAITQGGTFPDIRRKNTERLVELDFPGYGIGGLSIGEGKEQMFGSLEASTSYLPVDRPRYFMGVGEPTDLIRSVLAGVDIFDSVFPTRNARHRSIFLPSGRENIRASRWKGNEGPIMEGCACYTCSNFSRAFIHHLFKAQEPLGPRLATIHNVHFMQDLVKGLRTMILESGVGKEPANIMKDVFDAFQR
ncbi:MAG: tRNA guanosine(34) transglycosylase Tgt [Candidatus Thermoplasmatota archaeon]|nr:tRNA guanosine(34) transglycosylase Tgt [Candidatus Thermoplasmatota archaeon]